MPRSLRTRLEMQLDALSAILADSTPAAVEARPPSGEWSARENLAHLARHHAVFLERLDRVIREDRPHLGRYSAEEDSDWPTWSPLPLDEVLRRMRDARRRLLEWVTSLTEDQVAEPASTRRSES